MRRISIATVLCVTAWVSLSSQSIPQDSGAAGAWQKILKVRTTASVLHATAHPDDENAGVLAVLGRRDGARVALMTLTRGESGDNAIGSQLFDGLALIRTDELLTADKYYGVDEQYFTTVVDYGFSKRLDEALDKWGTEAAMRDVVRVIRMTRPWVLLSRFQGNERDGHGNHSAAGLLSQQAAKLAGDPTEFPEQIAEGLRPWTPFKVYMGGVRANEPYTLRIDSGEYSPWLGDSYDNTARFGLSFQRSQNSGRFTPNAGPYVQLLLAHGVARDGSGQGRFDLGRPRHDLRRPVQDARAPGARGRRAVTLGDRRRRRPRGVGLHRDRSVSGRGGAHGGTAPDARGHARIPGEAEALFVLGVKERQFQDAITRRAWAGSRPPLPNRRRRGGGWTRCRRRTICARGDDAGARAGSDIRRAGAARQSRRRADSVRPRLAAFEMRTAARVDGVASSNAIAGRRHSAPSAGLARHEVAIGRFVGRRRRRRADQHQALFQPREPQREQVRDLRSRRRSAGRSTPRRSSRSRSTPSTASPWKISDVVKRRESKAPYGDATREVRDGAARGVDRVTDRRRRPARRRRPRRWICRSPSSTTRKRRRRDRSRSRCPPAGRPRRRSIPSRSSEPASGRRINSRSTRRRSTRSRTRSSRSRRRTAGSIARGTS